MSEIDETRKKFEAWWWTRHPDYTSELLKRTSKSGAYDSDWVNGMWLAWNAARPAVTVQQPRRRLSLIEILCEHRFDGYTLCSCKHEKFDIPMEELLQKYPAVNRYVFEAEQHRAYAEHIADLMEKLG